MPPQSDWRYMTPIDRKRVWQNVLGETCPGRWRNVFFYQRVHLMYSLVIRLGEKLLISLFLSRPSSLELGRSVLIMGARVIQLIGAILDPAEGSLVGNRFSRGHTGGG